MKKNISLILDKEFIQYCEVNKIEDVTTLAKTIFGRGFTIEKYGETPNGKSKVVEKIVTKEIIVEKQLPPIIEYVDRIIEKEVIKEVPVEKIVEKIVIKKVPTEKIVEIIKEVPVEIKRDSQIITKEVIKEVPVEKIVEVIKEVTVEKIVEVIVEKEIINNDELDKIKKENTELKLELDKIKTSLEKFNRATYMKNSNLGSLYDE